MARAIEYAGLIGHGVRMEKVDGSEYMSGTVNSVMDWDDGSGVCIFFANKESVDVMTAEEDQWRFWIGFGENR